MALWTYWGRIERSQGEWAKGNRRPVSADGSKDIGRNKYGRK